MRPASEILNVSIGGFTSMRLEYLKSASREGGSRIPSLWSSNRCFEEKRERVKMLEMMNTPIDYEERKKAFIALELARHEANIAETALRQLNPYQL